MHDPIIIPVTQDETKAELRSRGYSIEIPPPDEEEHHEPIIEPLPLPVPHDLVDKPLPEPHLPVIEPLPLPVPHDLVDKPLPEPHLPIIEPLPLPVPHDLVGKPLPIAEVDDRTQLIAGIVYAAFCVFIDERHIIKFDW